MKQFFDLIPLLVFFAVYKFYDIYAATGALMVVTVLQIAITWFTLRKLEKMHLITFGMVLVFGGFTRFWGVFFAIPLATLVKAVVNAWPGSTQKMERATKDGGPKVAS